LNAAVEEKLFQFLTPHESTSSNYFVCTLNGVAENALIESCKEQNLVIRGMATFCAIRRDIQQIVLGFAPYKPKKLLDSAAGLRSVFEMLHQRDSRCIRVAASK
jgi:arginine/lysine/ornithine decarboxylase